MPENQPSLPMDSTKESLPEQVSQQLAKQARGIRDLAQGPEFMAAVKALLPATMRPDRYVRVVLNATMRTPELLDCSKESFFRCMLDLAMYGLEPDGRRAHLIPFRNKKMCQCGHEMDTHRGNACSKCDCTQRRTLIECTLIIDYKGLAELVRRSGEVSYIHADVVYENDEWSYGYGTEAHLKHKPKLEDRGTKKVAYYSYVRLKDGSEDFIILSPAEVEKIRKVSKAPDSPAWTNFYDEMGKKTAFRRHTKWLPLSPEARQMVERDDEAVDLTGWQELGASSQAAEPEAEPEALPGSKLRDRFLEGNKPAEGQEPQP